MPVKPRDLLNPTKAESERTHKLRLLVPAPRSYFLDIKCPGCLQITTVYSHACVRRAAAAAPASPRGTDARPLLQPDGRRVPLVRHGALHPDGSLARCARGGVAN